MASRRRWYEKNPVISEAMHTWHRFPRSLQRVLASYLNRLIRQQHLQIRMIGPNFNIFHVPYRKLLLMYHAKKRRRWYDHDPLVRSAVHSLIFVEHGDMIRIAERIIHLRTYLERQELNKESTSLKDFERYVHYVFSNRYLKF